MGSPEKSCDLKNCPFNHNGNCLDKAALKKPYQQTGCLYFKNKNTKTEIKQK